MTTIPPRLTRLMEILLDAGSPQVVTDLANRCGVSRRTVFREIRDIDALVRPFGLTISTKVGEGVFLEGEEAGREGLRALVGGRAAARPVDADERRILLLLGLLTFGDVQKLQSYSRSFGVSGATLSHDLDHLAQRLAARGVRLVRKPGFGVGVRGDELSIRKAIYATLLAAERKKVRTQPLLGYPPPDIADGVRQLMETRFIPHLTWMTEESRQALAICLTVITDRLVALGPIAQAEGDASSPMLPIADFFADSLELMFGVDFAEPERLNLAHFLSGLRRSSHFSAQAADSAGLSRWKALAYQMIEAFDPELAPVLKLDDRLVDGLAAHLQSASVRISAHVDLNDPLADEVERAFPGITDKSARALGALGGEADQIPRSEASFLATHFGAALMRLTEHSTRRLRVAVVCGSGIGTSYLMASQLARHIGSKADLEICGLEDVEDWADFDLCVSSVDLTEEPVPVVRVNPLLTAEDVAAVTARVGQIMAQKRHDRLGDPSAGALREQCEQAARLLDDVAALLAGFAVVTVDDDCNFDQLARFAGYRFGDEEEAGRLVYEALIRREALSTQVVPTLGLVLLHARTAGVARPLFALIVPAGGLFTSPALQGSRCCVVMLAPEEAGRDTLGLLGRFSTALLEDPAFLAAVLAGDGPLVHRRVEGFARDFLSQALSF